MKFKFGKIGAIASSLAVVGVTAGLAAASTYPEPFVDGGVADVTVIYGGSADMAHASSIASDLDDGVITGGSGVVGDNVKFEDDDSLLNLGEYLSTIYSELDDGDLPVILNSNIEYTNDDGDTQDYDQTFTPGNEVTVDHQETDEWMDGVPFIGMFFDSDANQNIIGTYTLDFDSPGADCGTSDWSDCESTDIEMMGVDYFILNVEETSNGLLIDLFNSGVKDNLDEGETKTIEDFEITLTTVTSSPDECHFAIEPGGITEVVAQGESQKIGSTDSYIAVTTAAPSEGTSYCAFSLGTGKLTLENNQEVKMNDDELSGSEYEDICWQEDNCYNDYQLKAEIVNGTYKLEQIIINWSANDEIFLTPGSELNFPGFETMKFSADPFFVPGEEMTTVRDDGTNRVEVVMEIEDGQEEFAILYSNETDDTVFQGIGKDEDEHLVTSDGLNINFSIDTDKWFFVSMDDGSDDFVSYLMRMDSEDIGVSGSSDADNTTEFCSATDTDNCVQVDIGQTENYNGIDFYLDSAVDSESFSLTISARQAGETVYFDRVYSKTGLMMQLPIDNSSGYNGDGSVELGTTITTHTLNFTEQSINPDSVANGNSFTATIGFSGSSSNEMEVSGVSVDDHRVDPDSSELLEGYVTSQLATKTLFHNPSNGQGHLEIEYHGGESYANMFLSQTGEGGGDDDGIPYVDDSSVPTTNLIVVGGTCVNQVARTLLDMGSSPVCRDDYLAHDNAHAEITGDGDWVIQTYMHPSDDDLVATLVYGWSDDGADTGTAADYLIDEDNDVGTAVDDKVPA